MDRNESIQATMHRLETQEKQKIKEDMESCFCEFAEKMIGFKFTKKCKLDGISCSNYSKADLVVSCPVLTKK